MSIEQTVSGIVWPTSAFTLVVIAGWNVWLGLQRRKAREKQKERDEALKERVRRIKKGELD